MGNDHDEVIRLKEQLKGAIEHQAKLTAIVEDLTEDLSTFKGIIKTGKYVAATIIFVLGIMSHKSLAWLSQFVWGN